MKLKIIFLSANPYLDLKLDSEYNKLLQVHKSSTYRDSIEIKYIPATTIDDIIDCLNIENPNILHYSGHASKEGSLNLHDIENIADELLSKDTFLKLIKTTNKNLKLIFLNACHSKIIAQELIKEVGCVIGMNNSIGNKTAIACSLRFYGSLFENKTIEESFIHAIGKLISTDKYKSEANIPEFLGGRCKNVRLMGLATFNNNKVYNERWLKTKILSYYKKDFSSISLFLNGNKRSMEDIFINLTLVKKSKIENKSLSLSPKDSLVNYYEPTYDTKEIFNIKDIVNKSNKSIIFGDAGIGKTTLCKYIAYMWSQEKLYNEFEYVIYISLREWETQGLKGAIADNYIGKSNQHQKDMSLNIETLKFKTLFLFDGYDELTTSMKNQLSKEIALYHLPYFIVTSRPYGYSLNTFSIDNTFKTLGYNPDDIENYINTFFCIEDDKKQIIIFLDTHEKIKKIVHIPLVLEIVCSLWLDDNLKDRQSLNVAKLYTYMVDYILFKHKRKNQKDMLSLKRVQDILEKISFYGLQQQKIIFDFKFITDILEEDEVEFFLSDVINSGFLIKNKDLSILSNYEFEFIHLTFQEYFAALYVSNLSLSEQKYFIKKYKFLSYMHSMFIFLGGLITDKDFLIDEILNQQEIVKLFSELSLVLMCLSEINIYNVSKKSIDKLNNIVLKHFILGNYIARNSMIQTEWFQSFRSSYLNNISDDISLEDTLELLDIYQNDTNNLDKLKGYDSVIKLTLKSSYKIKYHDRNNLIIKIGRDRWLTNVCKSKFIKQYSSEIVEIIKDNFQYDDKVYHCLLKILKQKKSLDTKLLEYIMWNNKDTEKKYEILSFLFYSSISEYDFKKIFDRYTPVKKEALNRFIQELNDSPTDTRVFLTQVDFFFKEKCFDNRVINIYFKVIQNYETFTEKEKRMIVSINKLLLKSKILLSKNNSKVLISINKPLDITNPEHILYAWQYSYEFFDNDNFKYVSEYRDYKKSPIYLLLDIENSNTISKNKIIDRIDEICSKTLNDLHRYIVYKRYIPYIYKIIYFFVKKKKKKFDSQLDGLLNEKDKKPNFIQKHIDKSIYYFNKNNNNNFGISQTILVLSSLCLFVADERESPLPNEEYLRKRLREHFIINNKNEYYPTQILFELFEWKIFKYYDEDALSRILLDSYQKDMTIIPKLIIIIEERLKGNQGWYSVIYHETFKKFAKILYSDIKLFKRLKLSKAFIDTLSLHFSVIELFELFDKNLISIYTIKYYFEYMIAPLYLDEEILCSVSDGKEIKTTKKLDNKELVFIKGEESLEWLNT